MLPRKIRRNLVVVKDAYSFSSGYAIFSAFGSEAVH